MCEYICPAEKKVERGGGLARGRQQTPDLGTASCMARRLDTSCGVAGQTQKRRQTNEAANTTALKLQLFEKLHSRQPLAASL